MATWEALCGRRPFDTGIPRIDGRIDMRNFKLMEPASRPHASGPAVRTLQPVWEIAGSRWSGIDFSGAVLPSVRFLACTIEDCRFDRATLHDLRLWDTTVRNVTLADSDLRHSMLGAGSDHANHWIDVEFRRTDLRDTTWDASHVSRCLFADARLKKVDFQGTILRNCRFVGRLDEVRFADRAFRSNQPEPNRMEHVDFRNARFRFVEFHGLDMDTVLWPAAGDHVVLENYRQQLARLLTVFRTRPDPASQALVSVVTSMLARAGVNQQHGVLTITDLQEIVGDGGVPEVLDVLTR